MTIRWVSHKHHHATDGGQPYQSRKIMVIHFIFYVAGLEITFPKFPTMVISSHDLPFLF
jgi:hypothetical protein